MLIKHLVFIVLYVLYMATPSFAQVSGERTKHEKKFSAAVTAFGKQIENDLKINFLGKYPTVKFIWTEDDFFQFMPFWAASYLHTTQTITIGPKAEHCNPAVLTGKKVKEGFCPELRGLMAHEYAHHYVYIEAERRSATGRKNWLGNKLQRPFARRLIDEGIAEYFRNRYTPNRDRTPREPDLWFAQYGTQVPRRLNSLYASKLVWIGGRIIVEPVLSTDFHKGLNCLFDNPLIIETYRKGKELHMKIDSLFSYRKRMIKCAKEPQ